MSSKKEERKQIVADYNDRKIIGGIYQIKNNVSNKFLFSSAVNLDSPKNAFDFATKTKTCIKPQLQSDFNAYGAESFSFETLEELWLEKIDLSHCVNHKN